MRLSTQENTQRLVRYLSLSRFKFVINFFIILLHYIYWLIITNTLLYSLLYISLVFFLGNWFSFSGSFVMFGLVVSYRPSGETLSECCLYILVFFFQFFLLLLHLLLPLFLSKAKSDFSFILSLLGLWILYYVREWLLGYLCGLKKGFSFCSSFCYRL